MTWLEMTQVCIEGMLADSGSAHDRTPYVIWEVGHVWHLRDDRRGVCVQAVPCWTWCPVLTPTLVEGEALIAFGV